MARCGPTAGGHVSRPQPRRNCIDPCAAPGMCSNGFQNARRGANGSVSPCSAGTYRDTSRGAFRRGRHSTLLSGSACRRRRTIDGSICPKGDSCAGRSCGASLIAPSGRRRDVRTVDEDDALFDPSRRPFLPTATAPDADVGHPSDSLTRHHFTMRATCTQIVRCSFGPKTSYYGYKRSKENKAVEPQ